MAAKVNWSQFLAGLIKHGTDVPKLLDLGDKFIKADWGQKWPAFRDLMDLLHPIILDMGLFSAQEFNVTALEAEIAALGFDGSRLKKLFDALAPILVPLLLSAIKNKQ